MDAFYASVEQRDNPAWRGLPVLVGGTGPRGVVAAASYEARRFGARSAMPMSEALRRCSDAICVHPRMDRYREVSSKIFEIFRSFTPVVQGLSLDEAFLDVSKRIKSPAQALNLALQIKRQIRQATGLTASVGIGPNKLVAKIASDLEKPDGLVQVARQDVGSVLDPLSVRAINGIGPRTGELLAARGIKTIKDLRSCQPELLLPVFGRYTARMLERARGIDSRPVESHTETKSISAEETFDQDLRDFGEMLDQISLLARRTAKRLARKELQASTISIKVRDSEFHTLTRQHSFSPATDSADILIQTATELLEQWRMEHPRAALRLLGVTASGLEPARQMDLFARQAQGSSSRLQELLGEVQQRYGDKALQLGQDLGVKS
jgi:DNA polymerase-4